jgi:hypothetical protein
VEELPCPRREEGQPPPAIQAIRDELRPVFDELLGEQRHYILDEQGDPVPCDFLTWAEWLEQHEDRHVRFDRLGRTVVSTAFIGLDLSSPPNRHYPVLWETMVFGGIFDGQQARFQSRVHALAAHELIVAWLRPFVGRSHAHIRKICREKLQRMAATAGTELPTPLV